MSNLASIRDRGISEFIKHQKQRIKLLRIMIETYDDGRSKAFFCRTAALLEPTALQESLHRAKSAKADDIRDKAKVLRGILEEAAIGEGIELRVGK